MKFVPTPPPHLAWPKIACAVEAKLKTDPNADEVRAKIKDNLRRSKLCRKIKCNITAEQLKTLKAIKANQNITILRGDKGNVTVICDKSDVDMKIKAQLNNPKHFVELTEPNLNKFQAIIRKCTMNLVHTNVITKAERAKLLVDFPVHPFVFAQVKVHKEGNPLRLITVAHNSVNSALALFIKPILKQLAHCSHGIKNSSEVMEKLKNTVVPPHGALCSFDVQALFPSISQKLLLRLLERRIDEKFSEVDCKSMTKQQLLCCVSAVLHTTYVVHDSKTFQQICGVPAGSCISGFLCDIALDYVDQSINESYSKYILYWGRYLDDTLSALRDASVVTSILRGLNNFDDSLVFTHEMQTSDRSINFLDLTITAQTNGCKFGHFIKPTQTTRTVSYHSAHPKSVMRGVLWGEVNRSLTHCTEPFDRQLQMNRILDKYLSNGYPEKLVRSFIKKMGASNSTPAPHPS